MQLHYTIHYSKHINTIHTIQLYTIVHHTITLAITITILY